MASLPSTARVRLTANSSKLSIGLIFGLVVALWSANSVMSIFFDQCYIICSVVINDNHRCRVRRLTNRVLISAMPNDGKSRRTYRTISPLDVLAITSLIAAAISRVLSFAASRDKVRQCPPEIPLL